MIKRKSTTSTVPASAQGEKPKKTSRRKMAELLSEEECPTPAEAIERLEFRVFLREIGVEALNAMAADPAEQIEDQLGKKGAKVLAAWSSMSDKRRGEFLDAFVEKARLISESEVGPLPAEKKSSSGKKKKAPASA